MNNPALARAFASTYRRVSQRFDQFRLMYGVLGEAAALVGLLFVNKQQNALAVTAAECTLAIIAILFLGLLGWIVVEAAFGKPATPTSARAIHKYTASPYIRDRSHPTERELAQIDAVAAIAAKAYSVDTIKPSIVRAAILKGAGAGVVLEDDHGRAVGFVDVYHLTPTAHSHWIDGTASERDLAVGDFASIDEIESFASVDLIVGAISVDGKNIPWADVNTLGMAALGAATHLISRQLARFRTINLYASIYSPSGERYATLLGFQRHKSYQQRGALSNSHDIYLLSFQPKNYQPIYFSNNPRSTVILTLTD